MAKTLEVGTELDAPPEVVWKALSELGNYPRWNSRTHFADAPVIGRRQKMRVMLFGRWLTVAVVIEELAPLVGLRWKGGISGICTGSHYFKLQALTGGKTRLVQGETFEGLAVPLLVPLLERELRALYDGMFRDLRAYLSS